MEDEQRKKLDGKYQIIKKKRKHIHEEKTKTKT